jgi:hypothetical protein
MLLSCTNASHLIVPPLAEQDANGFTELTVTTPNQMKQRNHCSIKNSAIQLMLNPAPLNYGNPALKRQFPLNALSLPDVTGPKVKN